MHTIFYVIDTHLIAKADFRQSPNEKIQVRLLTEIRKRLHPNYSSKYGGWPLKTRQFAITAVILLILF